MSKSTFLECLFVTQTSKLLDCFKQKKSFIYQKQKTWTAIAMLLRSKIRKKRTYETGIIPSVVFFFAKV